MNISEPGSANVFGQKLRAVIPGLAVTQPRVSGERERHYTGVDLSGR
jgi:hypothetical protein